MSSVRWPILLYTSVMSLRTSVTFFCASSNLPIFIPSPFEAAPRCVSRTCPTFIRDGTPNGFNTISTGSPFSSYGMSSTGMITEITPLLPWRPAILSPG